MYQVKAVVAVLVLSLFVCGNAKAQETAGWRATNQMADWPGNDYGCSFGRIPQSTFCDENKLGNIAVCWDDRPGGYPPSFSQQCLGAAAWCTYKNVRITTPAVGLSPGRVYICAK
jgi:hypothetical protein